VELSTTTEPLLFGPWQQALGFSQKGRWRQTAPFPCAARI
jgi:hypothetical protein